MKSTRIGYGFVSGGYALVGILPIFWCLLAEIDSITVFFQRTVWSALLLGGVLLYRGELLSSVRSLVSWQQLGATCMSTFFLGSNWFLYVWAMKHKELFAASMAYYICPLMTMAGAALIFRERFSYQQKVAIAFIIAGVALPALVGGTLPVLAVLIAASWSGYILIRRYYERPALGGIFLETLLLALILSVLLPIFYDATLLLPADVDASQIGLFALSGVVTAVPMIMMIEGMKLIPLKAVGLIQYATPTLTLVTSVFYFGASTTPQQLMSLSLVWGGILVFFGQGIRRVVSMLFCRNLSVLDGVYSRRF
jgi:chloramphenicol-sensitive protein RarD